MPTPLEDAQAHFSATIEEPDPLKCEALAERIGELLKRHNTAEIALKHARALQHALARTPVRELKPKCLRLYRAVEARIAAEELKVQKASFAPIRPGTVPVETAAKAVRKVCRRWCARAQRAEEGPMCVTA